MDNQEPTEDNLEAAVTRAAIYARVSSAGQLKRDGDDDGYSIPAQVKACEHRASVLGAEVAKAYVEKAESARSDDRPVLQLMLQELPKLGVKYLIVHKVDRLARNRLDDALLYQRLVSMGIKLVSASENIDETPSGRLMHAMLAGFAEYYSNNLATEIKKGLLQKHAGGGTPFKPPIGYRSKRELIGNADIRSVEVDPVQAPLVQLAFDLYRTGNWPLSRLTDHLEAQGLRYRATLKRPERPLGKNRVHDLLRNPYYVGVVNYCGRRVIGTHESLIDWETFDEVQAILEAHRVAGDRPSRHEHYLRGTLFCADCGGRLLYGVHRGNGGQYEYYSCTNRRARHTGGRCESSHFSAAIIEEKLIEHYRTVRLTKKKRDEIRNDVIRDTKERAAVIEREMERHKRTIAEIQQNQARLVQMAYKGLVDDEVLASEQSRLQKERSAAAKLLADSQVLADEIAERLQEVLERTRTPYESYRMGTPNERRILNQTFFKRILVGADHEILGATLTKEYAAVALWTTGLGQPRVDRPRTAQEAGQGASSENPDPDFQGQGSHLIQMVELAGLEPATSWVRSSASGV
jgi:site-specific DNA recombinase